MKMKERSIAIALQQHSYRAARAYLNSNTLDRYYTTVYNDETLIYKIMGKVLPKNLALRATNRKIDGLKLNVKKYCEIQGLVFLGLNRIPFLKTKMVKVRALMNKRFSKRVVRDCIQRNTRLLLMYDTGAYDCFKSIKDKKISIVCLLDMASICVVTIKRIIDEEIAKDYSFCDSMREKAKKYTEYILKMYVDEIRLADYILSPSSFVTNSLINIGIDEKKIKYLPHGVDENQFIPKYGTMVNNGTLHFLFVGRVEAAKGIYYLVQAFNDKRIKSINVELLIVGEIETNIKNFENYSDNIKLLGLKRREEMPDVYFNSDVFILSSLWEGSSLSMLEAMSSGLPVIASKYSCAPEIVEEYREGFVIEPKNIEEIVQKILWYNSNRNKIPKMSENARQKIVKNYTWNHYYDRLNKISEEILCEIKK